MNRLELFKVFVSPTAVQELSDVLSSGMLTQGPRVETFEKLLREFLNVAHVDTVNSATSGLQLALQLLKRPEKFWSGIKSTDKVLTPALTCWAATCSILNNDLTPVWIDADPLTGCASLADIEDKLTAETKVVEIMHWGGTTIDVQALDRILDEAEKRLGFRPVVIEDCAHAFGASYPDGRPVGSSGNICVFSFQAIKTLTCGDGGAIVFPDTPFGVVLHRRARLLRWFGIDRDRRKNPDSDGTDYRLEGDVEEHGGKLHMNDFNAALGIANLPHVRNLIDKARNNCKLLCQNLSKFNHVRPMSSAKDPNFEKSSCWLFSVWVSDKGSFFKCCHRHNITTSQVHRRNDVHSCVARCHGFPLAGVEEIELHLACLPCGWWISSDDIGRIIKACDEYENECNRSGSFHG